MQLKFVHHNSNQMKESVTVFFFLHKTFGMMTRITHKFKSLHASIVSAFVQKTKSFTCDSWRVLLNTKSAAVMLTLGFVVSSVSFKVLS